MEWTHWTLERPWALAAAPAVLWAWYWLARRPQPRLRYTGAFRFWSRGETPSGGSLRRRWWPQPAWLWVALALLWLAWLGPKRPQVEELAPWHVYVDESPSMGLPMDSGETRWSLVWEALQQEAIERPLQWWAWRADAWQPMAGAPPWEGPREWTTPAERPPDREGVLWLTDDAPSDWQRGSWLASGGPAVPGPVALWQDRMWWWSPGQPLREVEAPVQRVAWQAQVWPQDWLRLVRLWAQERGLVFDEQPGQGSAEFVALSLEASTQGPWETESTSARLSSVSVGSFSVQGRPPVQDRGEPQAFVRPWEAADGAVLALSPGRLGLRWQEVRWSGDGQALALDLAAACDRARRLPPEIVPIPERQSARSGVHWGPPPAPKPDPANRTPWAAWLAVVGALCILAAWPALRSRA